MSSMLFDNSNTIFQLAVQFVEQTARPIFLTGKAGTGKTTFLKYIRENCFKKMAVVAPTGVAAINAGGVTLHSFFQLPFGPFIPTLQSGWDNYNPEVSDQHSLFKNIRFNNDKRQLLQEIELLVIDEISMVRADMLDAVDTILRHFRQQPLIPFGGLQILYIGDLFQLPPVVRKEEWDLLQPHYKSPFFFDAQALQQAPPVYLELKKIYRQNEASFIDILNNVRNNRTGPQDLEQLQSYYRPGFRPGKEENYITLTSHNAKADEINRTELHQLTGKQHAFEATVTGEFNDRSFPAEKTLQVKEGAQIMFLKNDKGDTRRYFNGKIGTIKKITGDKILVVFPEEKNELTVEKETWKNIRYNYNTEKDKIEEEELGSFSQYPIRLAWAITIHKSQGLTFEKAIIDAGASFAPGQVYVALSRLTAIDGLILHSRILPHCISTDERVIAYTESRLAEGELQEQLQLEQNFFISRSLIGAFNLSKLVDRLQANYDDMYYLQIPDKENAVSLAKQWLDKAIQQQETALKFSRQLEQLLASAAENGYIQLQDRIRAAAGYFTGSLQSELITPLIQQMDGVKIKKAKKYTNTLRELNLLFSRKKQQIEEAVDIVNGLVNGINTNELLSILQEQKKNTDSRSAAQESVAPKGGKPQKGDTNRISLELFKGGKTIDEIAALRCLAKTTIEGHLISFIPTGEMDIKEMVPENKIPAIITAIEEIGGTSINPIKEKLGDQYFYTEIKAVLKHLSVSKV